MASRTWFLCRSVSPIANSGEVVNLEWFNKAFEDDLRKLARSCGFLTMRDPQGDSSLPVGQTYQILYVYIDSECDVIEAIRLISPPGSGGGNRSSGSELLKYMLTHVLMDHLREGVGRANDLLREYQKKNFVQISSFLQRKTRAKRIRRST